MKRIFLLASVVALSLSVVFAQNGQACGRHGRQRGRLLHRRASCGAAGYSCQGNTYWTTVTGCASCGTVPTVPAWGSHAPAAPYAAPYQGGQRERIEAPPRAERTLPQVPPRKDQ